MKKIGILLLCCVLLMLSACGTAKNEPTTEMPQTTAEITEPTAQQRIAPELTAPQTSAQAQTTEEVFTDATVSVREAEDAFDETNADFFTALSDDAQTQIVFTTDAAVRDFKVLALSDGDFGADEKMHFTTKVLYAQPRLTPDRPLVLTTVFYGLIPNNGISYVDKDGVTHTFAVDMSGEDGSLYLWEFD